MLAARAAHAHLVETGFGAFYDGVAHVALTPADLLVVLALALLAGQRGRRAGRLALVALPLAWLAGGLVGARWPALGAIPLGTTATFLLAGLLVALDARLREAVVAGFVIAAGLVHGIVNGATMGPTGASGLALAGAVAMVFCVTAIVAAEVAALPAGWPRIVVRVAGSWIAAAGAADAGLARAPGRVTAVVEDDRRSGPRRGPPSPRGLAVLRTASLARPDRLELAAKPGGAGHRRRVSAADLVRLARLAAARGREVDELLGSS